MGLRAARVSFAAVAALCLIALPATGASAGQGEKDGGRPARTQSEARAESRERKAEPRSERQREEKSAPAKAHGKPSPAPTTSPQPKSNADMNPGGANNGGDCGAYCSTRDGSPSGNGKGDGKAAGKPCAGCVGKADNKNPPGQAPDGTDHNNGYECDGNQGVGKTNPAHTGCQPQPTVSPSEEPCVPSATDDCAPDCVPTAEDDCAPDCVPTAEDDCAPDCVPTAEDPCVEVSPTATPSVDVSPTATPSVKGVRLTREPNPPAVLGSRQPTTGSNASVALLLLLGFGLVAAGVAVTVAGPARQH